MMRKLKIKVRQRNIRSLLLKGAICRVPRFVVENRYSTWREIKDKRK